MMSMDMKLAQRSIKEAEESWLAGNTFQARSTNPAIITVFVHAIELIYQEYANALTMWCAQNPSHPSPVCKTQHCTFLQSLPNEPHGCILNPLVHQLTN